MQQSNLIHFTTGNGSYVSVDVLPDAKIEDIYYGSNEIELVYQDIDGDSHFVNLPLNKTYKIIGIAGELSEEQCKEIVDTDFFEHGSDVEYGYKHYRDANFMCPMAIQSFVTLLEKHSIPPTSIILKEN